MNDVSYSCIAHLLADSIAAAATPGTTVGGGARRCECEPITSDSYSSFRQAKSVLEEIF